MKRVFSLALTALLLAGCGSTPAASSTTNTAVTAETSTTEASVGSGEPLRLLQHGDEKQYYLREGLDNTETWIRYRIVDLGECTDYIPCDVEGCTHDSESCQAVFPYAFGSMPWVLDENTLLAMEYSFDEERTTLFLMDRECHNRRELATLDNCNLFSYSDQAYTDGKALYVRGERNNRDGIYRVDLADGTLTEVYPFALGNSYVVGVIGRTYLVGQSQVTYPDPTGDLIADAQAEPTGTKTQFLLNVDTGETRELRTFSSEDGSLNAIETYVVDDVCYSFNSSTGTLSTVDWNTGAEHPITDQMPLPAEYESPTDYNIEANLNGWLVFYNLPVIVNAETGEVRQRTDLPENLWNGYGHQPQIFLQLKDRLLVDCRYEPYTRTTLSTDGTPYTIEGDQMYLGLISIDDFLNGVPNYTEVCKAPY